MSAAFPRLSEHQRFKPHCAPYAVEDSHHELGDEEEEEVAVSPDEEYPSTDSASLSTPKSANGIDGDGAKRPRLDLTETAASRQVYDEFGEASEMDSCGQRLESDSMPMVASEEIDVSAGKLTLWQFLLELLQSNKYRHIIQWTNRKGEFILIQAEIVAKLWGMRKDRNHRMNYDKLSRALRYYYQKNILRKVHGHKFVYQFMGLDNCPEAAQKDYTKCSSTEGCAPVLSGLELNQAATEISSKPTHEAAQRKRSVKPSVSQNLLPLPFDSDSSLGRSLDPAAGNLFASCTDKKDVNTTGVGAHQHPSECAADFSGPFKTSSSPMITNINSFLSSLDCLTSAFQPTSKALVGSRYKQTDREIREPTNSSCSELSRESNSMPYESREVQQPPFLLPTKPAVNDPVSQLTNPYLLLANLYRSCEEFAHFREQEISTRTSADSLASREPANTAFKPIQPGDKSRTPRPVSPNCSCSCHLTSDPLICSPVNSINQYTDRVWPESKPNPVSPLQTDKLKIFTASPQTVASAYPCTEDSPPYSSRQLHHERHAINMRRLGEQLTRLHHPAVVSPPLSSTRSASLHPSLVQPCTPSYDRPGGFTSRPTQHSADSPKSQQRPQQQKQQSPTFTTDGQCILMPVPVELLQTWFHFLASSPALHSSSPGSTPPVSSFQSRADRSADVSSTNAGLRSANGTMSPAAPAVVVSSGEMKNEYSVH